MEGSIGFTARWLALHRASRLAPSVRQEEEEEGEKAGRRGGVLRTFFCSSLSPTFLGHGGCQKQAANQSRSM